MTILQCGLVDRPPQHRVVPHTLSFIWEGKLFLFGDGLVDTRDELCAAAEHMFQFVEGFLGVDPRDVEIERDDCLKQGRVFQKWAWNTVSVNIPKLGTTDAFQKERVRCAVVWLVHAANEL